MQIGMVGLGKMGAGMARRLLRDGHDVVAYDLDPDAAAGLEGDGARAAADLDDLIEQLDAPRVVWMMLPAGAVTAATARTLAESLAEGDVVVDGGNSRYSDTIALGRELAGQGVRLVDAGTSGGVWGLEEGFCLMVGAEEDTFALIEPLLATLAPENGYARVGPPGAGHFTKMVHNGIEYGLMQAYAEGFELLAASDFEVDLHQVAELWRHGSVIRSWLLDLAAGALARDPELTDVSAYVEDSGEGRWTVEEAIARAVPTPVIAASLFARFASRDDDSLALRMLSALRREFGGHAPKPPRGGPGPQEPGA